MSPKPMADPGEGPGVPAPPPSLFLDQTEARRAEKKILETAVEVWIRPPLQALYQKLQTTKT